MMFFVPKFYLDNSANDGGGATTDTQTDTTKDTPTTTTDSKPKEEIVKPILSDDELKTYGFDSPDALKNFLKERNKSQEEKQREIELENANFRKSSIENKWLKESDFETHKSLSSKADKDLVFEKYLTEFKEDNPEITDQDELQKLAKEDFDNYYKLNSENDSIKKRGESKITKEAKELRTPIDSLINEAKSKYEQEKSIAATLPEFEKFILDKVKTNTPDKAIIYKMKDGDEEIAVEIDLTEKERKEMAKDFANHKNFYNYQKGDKTKLDKDLDKKMQGWVLVNKKDQIIAKAIELGISKGKEKGSNVGANNPFPLLDKGTNLSGVADKTTDEQIRESHNNAAKGYQR